MAEFERLSVGIDGDLSGFERTISRFTGLLSRVEALGFKAGRGFDAGFGGGVTRTATRAVTSIEGLRVKLDQLTVKRDLSIDTGTITRLNREIEVTKANLKKLQGLGVEGPKLPSVSGNAVSNLLSYAGGLVSIGAALNIVRKGVDVIEDLNRVNSGLKAVSTSSSDLTRTQGLLEGQSSRLGLAYDQLADSYKSLKASTNGTKLEGAETERIFKALIGAGGTLKLTNEQLQGSLVAITQMLSKGKVSAEELNGQLAERLPGANRLFAEAIGVSTEKLAKMLENGEVLAADVLPKVATVLERTYGGGTTDNVERLTGATNRLTTQTGLFFAEFDQKQGVTGFFADLNNKIATTVGALREMQRQGRPTAQSVISAFSNTGGAASYERAARLREDFSTFDRGKQKAQLELLKEELKGTEAGPGKTAIEGLYRDLLKQYRGERRDDRRRDSALPVIKPVVDYTDLYKKDQERYDSLLKKEEALRAYGRKLDAAEVVEKNKLHDRLERGNSKKYGPKAGPLASIKVDTTIDILKRIKANYEEEITSMLASGKKLNELPAALVDGYQVVTDRLKDSTQEAQSLLDITKRTVDVLQRIEKLKPKGRKTVVGRKRKGDLYGEESESPDSYEETGEGFTQLKGLSGVLPSGEVEGVNFGKIIGNLDQLVAQFTEKQKELEKEMKDNKSSLAKLGVGALSNFAESLAIDAEASKKPLQAAMSAVTSILGDYFIAMGGAVLTGGKLEGLLALIPGFQAFAASAIGKIVTGGVLIAGGAAIKATKFADGGHVVGAGSATSDSIPAWLSNGEYVLKASAVRQIGVSNLNQLNQGKGIALAAGGSVGMSPNLLQSRVNPTMNTSYQNLRGARVGGASADTIKLEAEVKTRGNDQYITLQRTIRNDRLFGRGK